MTLNIEESRKRAQAALERAGRASKGPWLTDQFGQTIKTAERHPEFPGWDFARHVVAQVNYLTQKGDEDPERVAEMIAEHMGNAKFIAEARSVVPLLAKDLLEALEEIERLKAGKQDDQNSLIRQRLQEIIERHGDDKEVGCSGTAPGHPCDAYTAAHIGLATLDA